MKYEGLRDWLSIIEQRGELTILEDVDWNLEMGAVVDVLYREHPPYPPALIFDRIKDHKPGYRALFGHFASPQRIEYTCAQPPAPPPGYYPPPGYPPPQQQYPQQPYPQPTPQY